MKILSAIVAILMLFLTVQPALANLHFDALKNAKAVDNCCKDKKAQPSKKKQNNDNGCCNGKQCDNPFLACADCSFINRDNSSFSLAQVFIPTEKIRLVDDKPLSSYREDVWHPPEMV